jgi:uncharacterized phiE125 gp8 family phage protein
LELRTEVFPSRLGYIRLACPPVQAVSSITYVADGSGVDTTLDSSVYQVVGIGGFISRIVLAHNQTWPIVQHQPEAITVRYTAGYGDDWNSVPEAIRGALAMLVAYWFNQREAALIDPVITEVPFGVKAILQPYKVYAF